MQGMRQERGHRLAPATGVRESRARLVWMTICGGASELGLYARYHVAVFLVREVYLARIHAEESGIVWPADIFRDEMEVEMREGVRECPVVDFLRLEGSLHGTCRLADIGHEIVTFALRELVEVIDMMVVCHEAAASVCLLLEEEKT